jgi:hypothetical protein
MRFSHCLRPPNLMGHSRQNQKSWNQRYLGGFVSKKVRNNVV